MCLFPPCSELSEQEGNERSEQDGLQSLKHIGE